MGCNMIKVSKRTARRHYEQNKGVLMLPHKINIDYAMVEQNDNIKIVKWSDDKTLSFDHRVMKHSLNCCNVKNGLYLAYYVENGCK